MSDATGHLDRNEVVDRWGDRGGAWVLLDCEPVLLPFARLSMEVIELTRTKFPPLDLFVLRAVQQGIDTAEGLSGVLGIDGTLTEERVMDLCRQDLVQRGSRLTLTTAGVAAVEGNLRSPRRVHLDLSYDKVLERPVHTKQGELRPPREFRDLGWFEVPAARRMNPIASDLDLAEVEQAARREAGDKGRLIAIQSVNARKYVMPAHLMIWQAARSDQLDYAVVVGGALSEEHSEAIDRLGGLEYLKVDVDLSVEDRDPITDAFGKGLAATLVAEATPAEHIERLRERTASRKEDLSVLQSSESAAAGEAATAARILELEAEVFALRLEAEAIPIRFLDTVECRQAFERFRRESTRRLLIVAPWLMSRVVDDVFVAELDALCRSGVQVHIGWGYPEDESDGRRIDAIAEARLLQLASDTDCLTLGFLGDTHEKILVSDDVAVVGSFNWLSYGGRNLGKRQRLRRESALWVRKEAPADLVYDKNRERIEGAANEGRVSTPEGYGRRQEKSHQGPKQGGQARGTRSPKGRRRG